MHTKIKEAMEEGKDVAKTWNEEMEGNEHM